MAKIFISPHGYEWLFENEPINLFRNVHSRGWLSQSSQSTVNNLSLFIYQYGKIFQTALFLLEFLAFFLLRSRKWTITLLIFLCVLHLGIFIFGSMLFWKWMCIDLLLIWILYRNKSLEEELYSKKLFISSLILIAFSFVWLRPAKIAWYDTPANQYFSYEVIDTEGKIFELDKNQMNPYHQWFQYDQFLFLVNEPCLPISGFGYTTNYKIANAIKTCDIEIFTQLEKTFGKNYYNEIKKEKFDYFIKTYFTNRNHFLGKTFIPIMAKAPYHLYSAVYNTAYNNQLPIRIFKVIFNKVISIHGKTNIISKRTVD